MLRYQAYRPQSHRSSRSVLSELSLSISTNVPAAAISANVRGITLVHRLFDEFGIDKVLFNMKQIQMVARETVKAFLRETYDRFEGKPLQAHDFVSWYFDVPC